jgi:signal transduction histidine kinase
MFHSPLPIIDVGLIVLAAMFAVWKGDRAARIAGAISLFSAVALPILGTITGNVEIGEVLELTGDLAWAVALLVLVVRYASLWLGVTMLLQAAQFSLHAYYLVMERPHDLIHAWVNNLNELGITICIVIGTVLAIRRRMADAREAAEREARRQKTALAPAY